LLPTTPEKVHDFPALFVHFAVEVVPTLRQMMARLFNMMGFGVARASSGIRYSMKSWESILVFGTEDEDFV
jgi:hypothetical protein